MGLTTVDPIVMYLQELTKQQIKNIDSYNTYIVNVLTLTSVGELLPITIKSKYVENIPFSYTIYNSGQANLIHTIYGKNRAANAKATYYNTILKYEEPIYSENFRANLQDNHNHFKSRLDKDLADELITTEIYNIKLREITDAYLKVEDQIILFKDSNAAYEFIDKLCSIIPEHTNRHEFVVYNDFNSIKHRYKKEIFKGYCR